MLYEAWANIRLSLTLQDSISIERVPLELCGITITLERTNSMSLVNSMDWTRNFESLTRIHWQMRSKND